MAQTNSLNKSQYETLAAFRYALRKFLHFSEEAANAAGVTTQQHQALLAIKGFPGRDHVTMGELAERLQLRHHSAGGLVDRLALEKLVSRVPSTKDRRRVYIKLTARGDRVLNKLSVTHSRQLKRLSPDLNALLKKLADVES